MEVVLIILISSLSIAGLLVIASLHRNKKRLLLSGFELMEEKIAPMQVGEILEKTKTFSARELNVLIEALEMQANPACNNKRSLTAAAKKMLANKREDCAGL